MIAPHHNGTAKWQAIAGIATVCFMVIGAFIGLLLTVNSYGSAITGLTRHVDDLNARLAETVRTQNTRGEKIAALQNSLIEIETQFRVEDAMRNLMHANEMRTTAMLWRKVFDIDYPTSNAYYPAIGRQGSDVK